MPLLRELLKVYVLRSRSVALWPARSKFTPALQSVATLDTGERVPRPLPPLGLGLRFTKPHSSANKSPTAAVLTDQIGNVLIHFVFWEQFGNTFPIVLPKNGTNQRLNICLEVIVFQVGFKKGPTLPDS